MYRMYAKTLATMNLISSWLEGRLESLHHLVMTSTDQSSLYIFIRTSGSSISNSSLLAGKATLDVTGSVTRGQPTQRQGYIDPWSKTEKICVALTWKMGSPSFVSEIAQISWPAFRSSAEHCNKSGKGERNTFQPWNPNSSKCPSQELEWEI